MPYHPWDFCWASPRESSDPAKCGKDMRGEGYAYIWDKRKLKKSAAQSILADETEMFEPRILNSLSNDVNADCSIFARTPYYLRLEPRYGGFFELRFFLWALTNAVSSCKIYVTAPSCLCGNTCTLEGVLFIEGICVADKEFLPIEQQYGQ